MAVEEEADLVGRLELARGVLRQVEQRAARTSSDGFPDPDGRTLPVVAPLARLMPAGGLRRGGTIALLPDQPGPVTSTRRTVSHSRPVMVRGSRGPLDGRSRDRVRDGWRAAGFSGVTTVLWGLVAAASAEGAWVGVVGRPELGPVAAAEAGVRLERLALVPDAGGDLLAVASALLDGLDVVVVAGLERAHLGPADRERLAARARQRGAVLIALGPWPGADVQLSCATRWGRLGTDGSGRLRDREVVVRARGRGIAPAGREARLLLPAVGRASLVAGGSGPAGDAPHDPAGWAPVEPGRAVARAAG